MDRFKCSSKVIVVFGIVLKNVEDGSCGYFCSHENFSLLEWSYFVATPEDLAKLKNTLSNTNVLKSCRWERAHTDWKFYKLTIVTLFCSIQRRGSHGLQWHCIGRSTIAKTFCQGFFHLMRKPNKPCDDNLCLFRAPALHLHGNSRMNIPKHSIYSSKKLVRLTQQTSEVFS